MKKLLFTIMMLLAASVSFSQSYKLKYPTITLDAVNGTTVPYNFTVQGISNLRTANVGELTVPGISNLNSIITNSFQLNGGGTFSLPYSNTTVILGDGSRSSIDDIQKGVRTMLSSSNANNVNEGFFSRTDITGGFKNTDVGFGAGYLANNLGSTNLGYNAGIRTNGFGNIAIGKGAMYNLFATTVNYGTAIGVNSYANNYGISIGASTGYGGSIGSSNNTLIGRYVRVYTTSAYNNVIGNLQYTGGSYNNIYGRGYSGDYDHEVPDGSGNRRRAGSNNNIIGNSSYLNIINGDGNIVFGNNSGNNLTGNSSYNVSIGNNILGNTGDNWVTIADGQGNKVFETQATDRTPMKMLITDTDGVGRYKSLLGTAPTSATDTGTTGEIRVTADYVYYCIASNTWVRAALASW